MEDERPDPGDAATAAGEITVPSVRLFAPGTEIGRRYEVRGVLGRAARPSFTRRSIAT